jgi:hypothetical protein
LLLEIGLTLLYGIAQVLEQFLHHPIDSREEILESYMVGNRLAKFLGSILPTHRQYFSKDLEEARTRSQDQLVMVLKYLDQIALLIDKQEHQDYISSVLGADQISKNGAAAGNPDISFDRSSVSTECLDNTTISSIASKIRQTSLSKNSSRAYHWHRNNEEKESSSSTSALNNHSAKRHRLTNGRTEISPDNSILASSGTGSSIPTTASSSHIPLAVVSGSRKKNQALGTMTTPSDSHNKNNNEQRNSRIVTPSSSQHSVTKNKSSKLPEWPPKSPSSSSPSSNNIDKPTQNSPNRKTETLYLQYHPSKSSPPRINGEESARTSPDRKTDVLYLQYKPSNGLKMKKMGETSKRKHSNEVDDVQVSQEQVDSTLTTNTKHSLEEVKERNGNAQIDRINTEEQSTTTTSNHNESERLGDGNRMALSMVPSNGLYSLKEKEGINKIHQIGDGRHSILVDEPAMRKFITGSGRQIADGDKKSSTSFWNNEISPDKAKKQNINQTIQEEQSVTSTMEKKRQVVADEWHESYSRRSINRRHLPINYPSNLNHPKHYKSHGSDENNNDWIDDVSVASTDFQEAIDLQEAKTRHYLSNRSDTVETVDDEDDSSFPMLSSKASIVDDDNLFGNHIRNGQDGMPRILEEDGIPDTSKEASDSSNLLFDPKINQSTHSFFNDSSTKESDSRSLNKSDVDRDFPGGDRYCALNESDVSFRDESREQSQGMSPPRYAPAAAEWSVDGSTMSRDFKLKTKSQPDAIHGFIVPPSKTYTNSSSVHTKGLSLNDKNSTRRLDEKSKSSEQYSTTACSRPPVEMPRLNESEEEFQLHSRSPVVDSTSSSKNLALVPWEDYRLSKEKSACSRRKDRMEVKNGVSPNQQKIQLSNQTSGSSSASSSQSPLVQLQQRPPTSNLLSSSTNVAFDPFWSSKLTLRNGPVLREESSAFAKTIGQKYDIPSQRIHTTTQQRVAAIALEPPPVESAYFESFFDNENRSIAANQNNTDDSNLLLRCPEDLKSFGSISRKSNSHKKRGGDIQYLDQPRHLYKSSSSTCSRIFHKHHHPWKQQETSLLSQYPTFTESTSEESSVADRKEYQRSHFRGCVRFLLE